MLKKINFYVLQWFFIRLTKHMKKDENGKYNEFLYYSFMGFVLPMSGWNGSYVYLVKTPKYFRLDKKKNKKILTISSLILLLFGFFLLTTTLSPWIVIILSLIILGYFFLINFILRTIENEEKK